MGEPWTDVASDIVEGTAFACLCPITMAGATAISAFGTRINLKQITDESEEYTMNEPKNDTITKELTSGYVLEVPKISRTINGQTGYVKAAKESGVDTFTFKAIISKANFDAILAGKGNPFACMKGLGYDTTGALVGFAHLIGYISNLKYSIKHDIVETDITIKGGTTLSGSTYSAYNTAMTNSTIEPVGMGALTPKAITAGDYTNMLNGTIVRTAAS